MNKRIIRALILAAVFVLTFTVPVLAFIVNPTSAGFGSYSTNVIKVFRNLAETGDSLYTFHYAIPYASDNYSDNYPVETAAETIVFKIYDDAGNLKATFTPYVFPYFENNGYGDGIASIYFAASDNAPVWGSSAQLTIDGWPAYFSGFPSFSYTLALDDYYAGTTQEENRDGLQTLILLWCDRLGSIYEDTGVILKASSDAGQVLSSYGETYFSGAIKGLQAMCPELYFIQVYIPTLMDTSYNMTMADYYANRMTGSQWDDGFTHMGQGIGVSGTVMATLIFIGLSILACIISVKKGWGIEAGAGISVFIGTAAALVMGNVLFAILMIVSLAAVVALIWLLMLRRVG